MKPSNIFVIASFIFVLYLLVVVVYEVYTGNLPSDDRKTIENISHKYGPDFLPHAYGSGYKFVYCMDEDSNFNYTYPEGTACNKDPKNQDDYITQYSYDKDGNVVNKETKEKDRPDKDRSKDSIDKIQDDRDSSGSDVDDKQSGRDNKYSIQICPPKCPKDYAQDEDDEEEDDEYEDKDEDEDKKE